MPSSHSEIFNIPNALSFARLPLAIVLFACIVHDAWLAGLVVFVLASITDWADGWWARKYGPLTVVGRNLDPMTDKVLVCGTFIYMITKNVGIEEWMAVLVVSRELIVTGIRGIVEATGRKFGADWFGKLKMILQCAVIIGVLLIQWLSSIPSMVEIKALLEPIQNVLLWAMLLATLGSGLQYCVKAARLLGNPPPS